MTCIDMYRNYLLIALQEKYWLQIVQSNNILKFYFIVFLKTWEYWNLNLIGWYWFLILLSKPFLGKFIFSFQNFFILILMIQIININNVNIFLSITQYFFISPNSLNILLKQIKKKKKYMHYFY